MYCPFAKESSYRYTRMHSPLADQHTKLEKLQEDGEQQYDFEYVVGVFVHGSALTRRQPAGSVHVGRDGEHPESFDAGQGVSRSGCMGSWIPARLLLLSEVACDHEDGSVSKGEAISKRHSQCHVSRECLYAGGRRCRILHNDSVAPGLGGQLHHGAAHSLL